MNEPLRIVTADDSYLVREGARHTLQLDELRLAERSPLGAAIEDNQRAFRPARASCTSTMVPH